MELLSVTVSYTFRVVEHHCLMSLYSKCVAIIDVIFL